MIAPRSRLAPGDNRLIIVRTGVPCGGGNVTATVDVTHLLKNGSVDSRRLTGVADTVGDNRECCVPATSTTTTADIGLD